jgi:ATP-dependent DNA helicase MPH1
MEETLEMAYRSLQDLHNGGKTAAGKPSKSKLNTDPNFKLMLAELDIQRNSGDFLHPKMDKLKTIVVQHFAKAQLDEGDAAEAAGPAAIAPRNKGTRAIVFATFRDVVEEIVEMLNQERPLINATRFIGQSSDKSGKKGFAQKDQIEVSALF